MTKNVLLIVAAGALSVILLDMVGSFASLRFGFNYGILSVGSFIIYGVIGYAVMSASGRLRESIAAAVAVGAVDATLGWFLSWKIGPGEIPNAPLATIVVTALVVAVVIAGAAGAIGAWLARRIGKH